MKKVILAGIIALIMSGATLNAQTWQIGYPDAASLTATLQTNNSQYYTLTISGNGAMRDFTEGAAPWFSVSGLKGNFFDLIIQPGITHIGNYAFCSFYFSEGNLIIPNTVTSIGASAFEGFGPLLSRELSVIIPSSVVSIGSRAFEQCSFFAIEVDAANPSYSSEDGVLFDKKKTTLISCPRGKSGSYTIPSSVTSIGEGAFNWCTNLTSITMPNTVTSIGNNAFNNLSIASISLSNNLTSIGEEAFRGLGIDYIKLPKSLTNIADGVFLYCNNLKKIEVEWDPPLAIRADVFWGLDLASCTLIVPTGKTALYKAANVWKSFGAFKESVSVTGITLNQTSATIILGVLAPLQLFATITPTNATYPNITWESSNNDVAIVDATGVVTAMNVGTAVITATTLDGRYTASCTIAVQHGDDSEFVLLNGGIYPNNYSYKTIDGAESNWNAWLDNKNVVGCLDFSKGPFEVSVIYQANKNVKKSLNVSLYVPKKAFMESFTVGKNNSCFLFEGGGYLDDNYIKHYPTLDDLEKIKEFTIETSLAWDDYYNSFRGKESIPWDGTTDPVFTNGKSYPVQDNVVVLITDLQTGTILTFDSYDPFKCSSHVSRYRNHYTFKFTPKEHSVVCDIYFMSQLPITKAVTFFGYECGWDWADWSQLKKGGIEKMVLSLLTDGPDMTGFPFPLRDDYIPAYQVFDNLSPDGNGIYHISWEMKDLQGKYFDVGKIAKDFSVYNSIGLYVEGDGQETYNLGIPEYGGQYHQWGENKSPFSYTENIPPRPLKPDEPVNYPEFEITDGILYHYHGKGGEVVIPESVHEINEFAFYKFDRVVTLYEHSNIDKITLPRSLKTIGNFAFHNQTNLTSITIPDDVTSIGNYAFSGCDALKSIVISGSVTSIGVYAFPPQYSLYDTFSVICYAATPPTATLAFPGVNFPLYCTLYVPQGTKALYQAAPGWKDFKTITELGAPPTDVTLNQSSVSLVAGNTLQLTATVAPSNTTIKDVSWSSSNNNVATVSADGKVTGIAPGTATITVTTIYGNKTAQCVVTVTPATACIEFTFEEDAINQQYTTVNKWGATVSAATVKANPAQKAGNMQSLQHTLEAYNTMVAFNVVLPEGKKWSDVTGISVDIYATTNEWKKLTVGINSIANAFETENYDQITREGTWMTTVIPASYINNNQAISESLYLFTLYLGVNDDKGTYLMDNIKILLAEGNAVQYISSEDIKAYISGNILYINSPESEVIRLYSVSGSLLYNAEKPAGKVSIPLNGIQDRILIIRSSSGWVTKGIRK